MTARLDPRARDAALSQLGAGDLDVLVVGGGLVGAGTALDAVSRGLRVGLVERGDWGGEAASHSGMVVGGNWSDLASLEVAKLRGALRERGRLMEWLAPHLVRRTPFLYPLEHGPRQRLAVGAEVLGYDTIARSMGVGRLLPAHRHLSRRVVRRIAPAVRADALTGGVQFYDAQVDDARLTITLVRTASAYGAQVANRAELTLLHHADDRVWQTTVRDHLSGADLAVRARVVVLAGGANTPGLLRLADLADAGPDAGPEASEAEPELTSRTYLVLPRSSIRSSTGLVLPTPAGWVRVVPWGRHWLVGPQRRRWTSGAGGDLTTWPEVEAADVDDLLASVNEHLGVPLTADQVEGCYADLQPVGQGADRPSAPESPRPGLVVAGDTRLSTYRLVAAQTADAVARELGGLVAPSVTLRLPLLGADGYYARWNQRHLLARRADLHVARVEHLLNRYGSAADDLLQLIGAQPELGRPLPDTTDYLQAEVVYAVTHEGALSLPDVLCRRTRAVLTSPHGGTAAARTAARLIAPELGWTDTRTAREVQDYLALVATQRRGLEAARAARPASVRGSG